MQAIRDVGDRIAGRVEFAPRNQLEAGGQVVVDWRDHARAAGGTTSGNPPRETDFWRIAVGMGHDDLGSHAAAAIDYFSHEKMAQVGVIAEEATEVVFDAEGLLQFVARAGDPSEEHSVERRAIGVDGGASVV